MGYASPEYLQTGRLTSKNDVWSYGVFLYELITGRRPLDRNRPRSEQKLLEWVKPYLSDVKKFKLIVDPRLEGKNLVKSARQLAVVANRCLVRQAKSRPKMSEVLQMVNRIVEVSNENADNVRLPTVSLMTVKSSRDDDRGKGKRTLVDLRGGEDGWSIHKMWGSSRISTC